MDFRTELKIKNSLEIPASASVFSIGSCFSVELSDQFSGLGLNVSSNPFGITYNPVSISKQLSRLEKPTPYTEQNLTWSNGIFHSLDHHGTFSNTDKTKCLIGINDALSQGARNLENSDVLFLTLGTAFSYNHNEYGLVNNCHKLPGNLFSRNLHKSPELFTKLKKNIQFYLDSDPKRKVVLSVSPVRHLRDSFQENQLSKAQLITLCYELVSEFSGVEYFPAYELILDDLRDYRFYESDMCHPSSDAKKYVFDKFIEFYFDSTGKDIINKAKKLKARIDHRHLGHDLSAQKAFNSATNQQIDDFKKQNPWSKLNRRLPL
jgi:hypothetical protein